MLGLLLLSMLTCKCMACQCASRRSSPPMPCQRAQRAVTDSPPKVLPVPPLQRVDGLADGWLLPLPLLAIMIIWLRSLSSTTVSAWSSASSSTSCVCIRRLRRTGCHARIFTRVRFGSVNLWTAPGTPLFILAYGH